MWPCQVLQSKASVLQCRLDVSQSAINPVNAVMCFGLVFDSNDSLWVHLSQKHFKHEIQKEGCNKR